MQYDSLGAKKTAVLVSSVTLFSVLCIVLGFEPWYIFGFNCYNAMEKYTTDAWEFLQNNYEERWDYNEDRYLVLVDVEKKEYDNFHKLEHVYTTFFRSRYCWVYDIKELEQCSIPLDFLIDEHYHIIYQTEQGTGDISELIYRGLFELDVG